MSECVVMGLGGKNEGAYAWSKEPYSIVRGEEQTNSAYFGFAFPVGNTFYYADSYRFDESTGKVVLVNPQAIAATSAIGDSLNGKYFSAHEADGAAVWIGTCTLFSTYSGNAWGPEKYASINVTIGTPKTYVTADKADAYPDSGFKDGYKYVKIT